MFLEGKTLEEQIEADKLFYVDYQDLEEYVMPASNEVCISLLKSTVPVNWAREIILILTGHAGS